MNAPLLALLMVLAPPAAEPVRVAAAASLKSALDEIAPAFRARHTGLEVAVSYGASGSLLAQLRQRAPFDLFLSADEEYPAAAHAEGLTDGPPRAYALGRLALWARDDSPFDPARGLAALREAGARRVAIANPRHAPYGRAAEAALRASGAWAAVQPKLLLGENVAQAAHFAHQGAADAGLVALATALSPAMAAQGRHVVVDAALHPPLVHAGVVLAHAARREAAHALLGFLLSDEGRAILYRHGYSAVP
jgi:molybdate transport system substrate-binding protein